jgi:hypothetical protein
VGLAARVRASWAGEQRGRLVIWAIFAVAALIAILILVLAGQGQTLKGDEWGYARELATRPLPDALFDPPAGKYLLVLPLLLYKAAFSTIGISDYIPYRLAAMALTVAAAALFLVLAARRVGYLLALPGAVLILFLGSSGEVTTTALRIPIQIAVVAGLGMLLALERRDLRGDVAACVLLAIAITSHPLGTAFAAAAVVMVLARPAPERWRRAWIFAVPLVLFAAWYLTLREPAPNSASFGDQLGDLPRFLFQSLTTMVAAITGAFRSPFDGEINFLTPVGYVLATIAVVAVGFRALTSRPPATFWAILVALLVLLAAPAFAPGLLRSPTASRYVFPGVIMLLLLFCETARGVQVTGRSARLAACAVVVVFVIGLYSNSIALDNNARTWASTGKQVSSELTALDLARGHVEPDFRPEDPSAAVQIPSTNLDISAAGYFKIRDAYGSPAFSTSELLTEELEDRRVADIVLARALDLRLRPAPSIITSSKATPPQVVATQAASSGAGPSCITLTPRDGPAASQMLLPRGGVAMSTSGGEPVGLALGRFDGSAYPLQPLQPRGAGLLVIPPGTDPTPWRLFIAPTEQAVTACGLDLSKLLGG